MHGYVNSFKKAYISRSMLKSTNISSTNNKNYQQESLGFSIPKFSNALSVLDICSLISSFGYSFKLANRYPRRRAKLNYNTAQTSQGNLKNLKSDSNYSNI